MSTITPKEKMDEKPTGRSLTWECVAEFFGTLALLIFGDIALAHGMLNTMNFTKNVYIAAGNIIGVVIGVAIVMKNSACHINPVVTIAFALWGRFPWKRVPGYIIAQYMAGIVGAGIVYLTFIGEMRQHEAQLSLQTAQIFTSFPGSEILVNRTIISHVTMLDGLSDQIWSTMILLVLICALIDGSSGKLPLKLMPFVCHYCRWLFLVVGSCDWSSHRSHLGRSCQYPSNYHPVEHNHNQRKRDNICIFENVKEEDLTTQTFLNFSWKSYA